MGKKKAKTEAAVVDAAVDTSAEALSPKAAKKAAKEAKKAEKANKKAVKADKKAAKADKKAAKAEAKAAKAAKKGKAPKKNKPANPSMAKKSGLLTNPIRNLVITALVSALVGVAFILEPSLVYSYSSYFIGGILALIGIVYIIIYFVRKPISGVYRSEFAIGFTAVLAGAYVALSGIITDGVTISSMLETIIKILGVGLALDGVLKLQYCLDLVRMKFKTWWLVLVMAVLGIALGVVTVLGYTYSLGADLVG